MTDLQPADEQALAPVRIPPVAGFVTEYHAAGACRVGRRADGVVVFMFGDFQQDTIRDVVNWNAGYLDALQAHEMHLIDLRACPAEFPVHAFQGALKANNHPNARLVRLAILVRHSAVAQVIDTIARVTVGAQARLFTDEDEANAWLRA